jgi:DNA-binding XRE family transcriptional regulator
MNKKKKVTHQEVMELLKLECEKESQAAFARKAGVSRQFITAVLKEREEPSKAVLTALGLKKVTYYEPL